MGKFYIEKGRKLALCGVDIARIILMSFFPTIFSSYAKPNAAYFLFSINGKSFSHLSHD